MPDNWITNSSSMDLYHSLVDSVYTSSSAIQLDSDKLDPETHLDCLLHLSGQEDESEDEGEESEAEDSLNSGSSIPSNLQENRTEDNHLSNAQESTHLPVLLWDFAVPAATHSPTSSLFDTRAPLPTRCTPVHRVMPSKPWHTVSIPSLEDDFYLNLLDWSANNLVAFGLPTSVRLWNAFNGQETCLPTAVYSSYINRRRSEDSSLLRRSKSPQRLEYQFDDSPIPAPLPFRRMARRSLSPDRMDLGTVPPGMEAPGYGGERFDSPMTTSPSRFSRSSSPQREGSLFDSIVPADGLWSPRRRPSVQQGTDVASTPNGRSERELLSPGFIPERDPPGGLSRRL
eukprot:GHVQ01014400.1.p1 GENE.GHVQ01014400.1~~GHVQ01014400.1.p1  ORF type:complete len:342 (+),score=35.79 GHVQ01014400.1:1725-2750(+)